MTESPFAYGNLTLDELRSLAASPQVGTLHAMPQSFRALADRVGEVADLLTHTQVNLHSWWKGPAAEQAAEALGKAAAEAREFHGSALAAASAVGRCAQVVEAQQHQMMNIPEVAEPGVTDVVRRPTTPLEALEAARQDNTYQAARQQAVQVVNGIAAQYVETRGQLASVNTFSGENFSTPTVVPLPSIPSPFNSTPARQPSAKNSKVKALAPRPGEQISLESHSYNRENLYSTRTAREFDPLAKFEPTRTLQQKTMPHELHSDEKRPIETGLAHTKNQPPPTTRPDDIAPIATRNNDTPQYYKTADITAPLEFEDHGDNHYKASRSAGTSRLPAVFDGTDRQQKRYMTSSGDPDPTHPPIEHRTASHSPPVDPFVGNDPAMIPPYSGLGSIHNVRERRNPRPAYLKERKSAWLPKTIAAPPNGVIGPDWPEEQ